MTREWQTYHLYLNKFFNAMFIENRDNMRDYAFKIARLGRMVKRIQDSKNTFVNDDLIIKEKKKEIQYLQERKSVLKAKQERLIRYEMDEPDINLLTLAMNKEIVKHVIQGKKYNFPFRMGTIHLKYVKTSKKIQIVNWAKSLKNHLKLTKEFAPLIYEQFIAKRITRREYYKAASYHVAPTVANRVWLHITDGGNWLYLRYKPNFAFHKKLGTYYRFVFTGYNGLANPNVNKIKDSTTETTLQYLDTPKKILNCWHLGSISKCVLLQIQDPEYKLKFTDDDLQVN